MRSTEGKCHPWIYIPERPSWPASGLPGHLDGRKASENGQNSDEIDQFG